MGIGDELMLAGLARDRAGGDRALRFHSLDKGGSPRWFHVWDICEHMARPGEHAAGAIPGFTDRLRHYCSGLTKERYTWRAYRPVAAALRLPEHARRRAGLGHGAVVFNPTIKHKAPLSKDWGIERWQRLISLKSGIRWVQIGPPPLPRMRGALAVVTSDFAEACAIMSGARAVVVHEGALHHAAAALGVPAVVIRGGFISDEVTGYEGQRSFFSRSEQFPLGCGLRGRCEHCAAAMASIAPDAVLQAVQEVMR